MCISLHSVSILWLPSISFSLFLVYLLNDILTQISTFMFASLPMSLVPALSGANGRNSIFDGSIVQPFLR